MSDAELIASVLAGHSDAFDALVDRYYEACARFSVRMLGNRQDAEDAMQEAFLRAYRSLARYQERDAFRPWLFRILVNQCRTLARRRTRRELRFVSNPDALLHAKDEKEDAFDVRDALQNALSALEPILKEALLLKYGEGLDYREMAAATGASVPALKMRVKRACDAMRPRLEAMLNG